MTTVNILCIVIDTVSMTTVNTLCVVINTVSMTTVNTLCIAINAVSMTTVNALCAVIHVQFLWQQSTLSVHYSCTVSMTTVYPLCSLLMYSFHDNSLLSLFITHVQFPWQQYTLSVHVSIYIFHDNRKDYQLEGHILWVCSTTVALKISIMSSSPHTRLHAPNTVPQPCHWLSCSPPYPVAHQHHSVGTPCTATVILTTLPQVFFAVFGRPQHLNKQLLLGDPASLQRPINAQHLIALISGIEKNLFKQNLDRVGGTGGKWQDRGSPSQRGRQLRLALEQSLQTTPIGR